ncbi:STAS domain-containing protein [Fictibacillus enclensis]|uniref:STAS domain-containing protein n=1 Tax=Fictibacillus enclensis TaxID=1017270 RepID=UPI0025A22ECA|nr:STAS domain-containing protein [Fictibacillus enclensis]MDM5337066.1 STAS domain-containing protein [Fictibacillus enclensis]
MEKLYKDEITSYIVGNREDFYSKLLSKADGVASKISEILQKGNIDLLKNAEKLVQFVVENREAELTAFARQEGIAWAEHSLTLQFKLEWVHAIRRTIWHYLKDYDEEENAHLSISEFRKLIYQMEKQINDSLDQFLNSFFISYSEYKDELINSQRKTVEHLSVPIIPLSAHVAVLPLIGIIDVYRMYTIEEKVLTDIARLKIKTLILDLSGITDMDMEVIHHFQKVLDGTSLMGCKAVITGLRPELVRKMIQLGVTFDDKAEMKGTLQQTLPEYYKPELS